jgi:hypothetical protein
MTAYKILRGTNQFGPYPWQEIQRYLADGRLTNADLAWVEEQRRWVPLTQLQAPREDPPPFPARNSAGIFVGLKYPYYEVKWAALEARASSYSWNWAAFFWGPLWMAYRKMYAYAWAYFALVCFAQVVLHLLAGPSPVSLVGSFLVGFHGNAWYKQHVDKRLAEIQRISSPQTADLELIRQGGTSVGAVVGFVLLLFALGVIGAIASDPEIFK